MARIIEYYFPASDTEDVCLAQNSDANGNFILNGKLANSINNEVSFIDKGYSRNISISSADDVSGSQFTIIGYQNGVKITELIANGPNADTIFGNEVYDYIISVKANNPINVDVSIGTGYGGYFKVNIDLNNYQAGNSFLSLITMTNPSISTTVYGTPFDMSSMGQTYFQIIATHTNILEVVKANSGVANYFNNAIRPYRSLLIGLSGTNLTANSVMYMNFIQATQFLS